MQYAVEDVRMVIVYKYEEYLCTPVSEGKKYFNLLLELFAKRVSNIYQEEVFVFQLKY